MLYRFLVLSLAVHMLFAATLLQVDSEALSDPQPIEVTYISPDQNRASFVTDPNQNIEDSIRELKDKVNRLSRQTRRVQEEVVARRNGASQNRNQSAQTKSSRAASASELRPRTRFPKPSEATGLATQTTEREAHSPPGIDRPANASAAEKVVLSESTIAEFIPEVREGGFTSLNTDQFLHYTFYARINEQIRNRWVQHLRTFANNAGPHVMNKLSQQPQITELEVLLDSEGNFQDVIFHRRADHSDLDVAAGAALERAAPFLNPPAEIVKEDGFIHLFYAFYIHWRPQYVAKPSR